MLIKAGVDISRLSRDTRRVLAICDKVFARFHQELIVTSTYEGTHSAGSLHYAHQALDIRFPVIKSREVIESLRDNLGTDCDVVIEETHIHIEYDPD